MPRTLLEEKESSHLSLLEHSEAGVLAPFSKLGSEPREAEQFATAMFLESD